VDSCRTDDTETARAARPGTCAARLGHAMAAGTATAVAKNAPSRDFRDVSRLICNLHKHVGEWWYGGDPQMVQGRAE